MSWFEDASQGAATEAPLPERRRSKRVLVAWLLAGGVLVGLLVAGGVSAVAHFVDNQNAAGPGATGSRPEPMVAALTCGDPAPPADLDTERSLTAQVQVLDARVRPTYAPGTELDVIAALVNTGAEVDVVAETDLAVVLVNDGLVASEPVTVDLRDPDGRPEDPYRMTVGQGIGVTTELTYPLVGCDGEQLAVGEYALLVGARVAVDGGEPSELVGESGPFGIG